MTNFDILKASISCWAIGLGALIWVFFSGQSLVARKLSVAVAIVMRIAIVHLIAIPVLCIGGGILIDYLAIPLAVMLVLAPLMAFEELGHLLGDSAIGALIVLPPYALKQFVLGFPDRGKFELEPPAWKPRANSLETIRNSPESQDAAELIAVAATPLKPFGYIDVDGQRMAASSSTGMLIDVGQRVRICSRNNNAIVVELADAPCPSQ